MTGDRATKRSDDVLAFAGTAERLGWTRHAFDLFCDERGLSTEARWLRWPKGERSMGQDLNAYADALTFSEFARSGPRPLSELLMQRFEQNEQLKSAVRALALSDATHPVDTLRRTGMTASLLSQCSESNAPQKSVSVGLLVILYSICVLVWLADRPPNYQLLRKATSFAARLLGAK